MLNITIKTLTAGVLLFLALILVRDRSGDFRATTGSVFLVSVALYLWCAIVHTSQSHNLIWLPLYAGCFSVPFCFYLFSRSLFEDHFKPGWFHGVLFVVILTLGYVQLLASDAFAVADGSFNDLAKITIQLGPALISLCSSSRQYCACTPDAATIWLNRAETSERSSSSALAATPFW